MKRRARVLTYVATALAAAAIGAAIAISVTSSDYRAGDSKTDADEPTPFPTAMDGYLPAGEDQTFVRLVGEDIQGIIDFPATMNGCSHGRFVVRWRSLDPDALIEFAPVYGGTAPDQLIVVDGTTPQRGTAGYWESESSCEQPSWKRVDDGVDESAITDVTVEYQEWIAAP